MPITLIVTQGPNFGRRFTFSAHDAFLVGRSKHAHFRLPRHDMLFSRIHFLIEVNPPRCCLVDMGSTNGTRINGRPVTPNQPVALADGDLIEAGDSVLHVSIDEEEASVALRPLPARAVPCVPTVVQPRPEDGCAACDQSPAAAEGLCAACAELARGQPQPIVGYRILREIGRGNMGVVYLAVRQATAERVALKTIIPALVATPEQTGRFLREAEILCQLHHPHIIGFHDMGESNGTLYFAMEYAAGIDAETVLNRHGPLPMAQAVRLICQLLDALEYAHGQGFVHRDIKPANLLVVDPARQARLRLADFGLARVYAASQMSGLTFAGDMGGTVAFMPPEQVTHFREARPPADLYSTAATLYNLLTNRFTHDFPRSIHDRLELILHSAPVSIHQRRPDIPARLGAVIHRALAKLPRSRFASAHDMKAALLPFAAPTDGPLIPLSAG